MYRIVCKYWTNWKLTILFVINKFNWNLTTWTNSKQYHKHSYNVHVSDLMTQKSSGSQKFGVFFFLFFRISTNGFSSPTAGGARQWAAISAWMHSLSASLPSLWIYGGHAKQGDSPQATLFSENQGGMQENINTTCVANPACCTVCVQGFYGLEMTPNDDSYVQNKKNINKYSNL